MTAKIKSEACQRKVNTCQQKASPMWFIDDLHYTASTHTEQAAMFATFSTEVRKLPVLQITVYSLGLGPP